MKQRKLMSLKFASLLAVFGLMVACTGSKAEQKMWKKAASEIYSELEKSAKKTSSGQVSDGKSSDGDSYALEDDGETSKVSSSKYDGMEIPVYTKGKISETVKKRYSYTLSYNHEMKNPNWVAWTITASHASGKVKRMDFSDDEDMPDPKGYLSDYYNSGYDRGHMCPAGDNKWSEKAMEDCFLITNMCPQNGGLNRGAWNSIEQQCRAWAKKYGKVYVVCGPIYLNKQHRKIGKNKVVVPEAFFKVVLCMKGTPKAIGFICRNQSQKGVEKTDFINTVDEVERITGYDFFSKLPDSVEKKVEAHADINEW